MNPGFYPGPPNGLMQHHHPGQMQPHGLTAHHHASVPTGQPQSQQQQQQVPPNQQPGGVQSQIQPNGSHESPYYRPTPTDRPDIYAQQINEEEFQEIMEKNKTVSSSAISRAVTDASMGTYPLNSCDCYGLTFSHFQVHNLKNGIKPTQTLA
jgi:cleavage and polyadenylation specificity factor subunit 6/7